METCAYLLLAIICLLCFIVAQLSTLESKILRIEKKQTRLMAQVIQLRKDLNFSAIDHLIAYILKHNIPRQEPGIPESQETKRWMRSHGISVADREALIYKYLEKALNPPSEKPV